MWNTNLKTKYADFILNPRKLKNFFIVQVSQPTVVFERIKVEQWASTFARLVIWLEGSHFNPIGLVYLRKKIVVSINLASFWCFRPVHNKCQELWHNIRVGNSYYILYRINILLWHTMRTKIEDALKNR